MVELLPLQFGIPGGMELVVILLIAVLLFGANKIPKLARSTGEAMGEFQKGREEVEKELQEMRDGATGGASGSTTPEVGAAAGENDVDIENAESETDAETDTESETDSETDDGTN